MSVSPLTFTKDWRNPSDFPTIETSEVQVREDLQILHEEAKDKINEVIEAIGGDNVEKITNAEIDAIITT